MQKLLRNVNVTHFYILYVFFCPEYFILIISALKKLYVARIQFNNNFFPLITRKQGGNLNNLKPTQLLHNQPYYCSRERSIQIIVLSKCWLNIFLIFIKPVNRTPMTRWTVTKYKGSVHYIFIEIISHDILHIMVLYTGIQDFFFNVLEVLEDA